jgi:hypothetical protein
MSSPVRKNLLS